MTNVVPLIHFPVHERVLVLDLDVYGRVTAVEPTDDGGVSYTVECEHPLPGHVWTCAADRLRHANN